MGANHPNEKRSLARNIERLKPNLNFLFQVIFVLEELSLKDEMKYEDFYIKQAAFLETKKIRLLTFFYKDFVSYINENGLIQNSKVILISKDRFEPLNDMGLILVDQFDNWVWKFK